VVFDRMGDRGTVDSRFLADGCRQITFLIVVSDAFFGSKK
jgi:hypothetical protein